MCGEREGVAASQGAQWSRQMPSGSPAVLCALNSPSPTEISAIARGEAGGGGRAGARPGPGAQRGERRGRASLSGRGIPWSWVEGRLLLPGALRTQPPSAPEGAPPGPTHGLLRAVKRLPIAPRAPRPAHLVRARRRDAPGPASRSARRVRRAAHGPGRGPRRRGRGPGSVRAASPSPPSPPLPPRGALARVGTRALRAGTRTHGAHPTRGSAGAAGAAGRGLGSGSGVRSGDGGARSRLGRRSPRLTGPGRRAGPPAGMRSCRAKKGPDVTRSQSARGARGQVTSAGAQLWVPRAEAAGGGGQPRRGCPPPSALAPHPGTVS